ncbi:E3 UFM1-protein ligase 1 homolog [Clytia hemisphaerica]|uniref:E3 UFM1-protein ligase 1 homolog n=1 Tax=Clytia hemisphaerica TaxID=252671 RepID=A0A7M6DP12_9CNID
MAASDWEEIKRLAADFQRAQLSSTAHKLSERNCIEIVNKLISLGLLDILYTTDGKEYLTPQELEKEIRDEVIVHGGRINLVDLQQILNVDLSHIESKVNEFVRSDRSFSLVQGELIDRDYLDRTAEEINESLQENGQTVIADVAKTFNLPSEFILSVIEARLGTIIHGSLDPMNKDVLFTEAFIARNIARIRGIFSAITRPTSVMQLLVQYNLPDKLFFNVLETLVKSNRLCGALQGRQEKAIFIPEIYSKAQTSYIDSFFKENGYIEYHTLSKIGIGDGQKYLKKRFSNRKESCMFLSTCCLSHHLIDRVDAEIEEILRNETWGELKWLLPPPLSDEDINQVLQHCLKGPSRSNARIFCLHTVVSNQYLTKCKNHFNDLMTSKAGRDIKTSPALFADLTKKEKSELTDTQGDGKQQKKDERHKKALAGGGQKGGAGRGGRESNTKKTKNKYRDRGDADDGDEAANFNTGKKKTSEIPFLTVDQISNELAKREGSHNNSDNEEFHMEIANYLHRPLTKEYQEVAKSIFLTSSGTSSVLKNKSHKDYQEKVNGLWSNLKLFEKGLKQFEDENQVALSKHLLKTIATDLTNTIFELVANQNLMSLAENETFTTDSRLKLLTKLPDEWKSPLTKLNTSLGSKSTDDFFTQAELITAPEYCDIMLKKTDKKKERQMLFNHRAALADQLERESEPAMALHLASIILFQYHTNTLLHAPGKFVPQIIMFLQNSISEEDFILLTEYHALVVQQLKQKASKESSNPEGTSSADIDIQLNEKLSGIKKIVKHMKKSQNSNTSET